VDKIVDALYKKLVILLAIGGGVWVYTIKFFEKNYFILAFTLFGIFLLVVSIILVNYVKMNKYIKKMEEEV